MKIVHLCTQDSGGAGIAAYRIHKSLLKLGLDSKMIVLNKTTDDNTVFRITDDYYINTPLTLEKGNSIFNHLQWLLLNIDLSIYPKRPPNLEIFTNTRTMIYFEKIPEIVNADIIHLHWIFGMFDYVQGGDIFKNKKIVWTLHDTNPFTGGCHYTYGCNKFENECFSCPQLGSNQKFDLSNINFHSKKNIYNSLNINIVTPSKWLYSISTKSDLFCNYQHKVIRYIYPLDDFKLYDQHTLRQQFNIPTDKKIILFVADSIQNHRKGILFLLKALEKVANNSKDFIVCTLGNSPTEIPNFQQIHFGKLSNPKEIGIIYNLADVFVIPSIEDNLPNTVAESLLCGTPVVGFDTGGIPEMVQHLSTGYIAPKYNVDELANGIIWCLENTNENMRIKCRQTALEMFDEERIVKEYLEVYKT
ncbi:MAG TPA: glycosyltransferase family 4 protein [Ignavibacteriales bacterium]|nr:glycosyltransferase family 4 protein [Ignavibacteriales bacterium]HOL82229.1 glycosyltransferase family 4 protein [Ignavibacteriales bacterium]HOM65649.1 glycosyltransferase family 4 protein [Ignavibacteriales bacterium]HPD67345.1 glycosyltransferase family 4 protein [Ignavibacteriales bacterium]HPP32870.1 glycosyltransferase family 4 protein [Ignavibacteriales bacterium]